MAKPDKPEPKSKDEAAQKPPEGVEGSGFNYNDAVEAQEGKERLSGHIVGIHAGGKRVDVRFDKPGHGLHGYTKTYSVNDVAAKAAEEGAEA